MQNRLKNYALVICLFVFMFVIIGGGLHLAPGGAFLAAAAGTPLVIFAFQSRFDRVPHVTTGDPLPRTMRFTMPATQSISLTNEGALERPDAGAATADLSLVPKAEPSPAIRRRLPDERRALTHHFSIAGQEGYLTVGVYEYGFPEEIIITMAKQGSFRPIPLSTQSLSQRSGATSASLLTWRL